MTKNIMKKYRLEDNLFVGSKADILNVFLDDLKPILISIVKYYRTLFVRILGEATLNIMSTSYTNKYII